MYLKPPIYSLSVLAIIFILSLLVSEYLPASAENVICPYYLTLPLQLPALEGYTGHQLQQPFGYPGC
ncbi:hypothetical protein ACFOG5_24765, partial [Pedobacter fastidiosus]|uniref:hypothetical protein n=1 Tax=Pedobacter fastidiosus TaxID=2765361 RepID=UPI00360D879B